MGFFSKLGAKIKELFKAGIKADFYDELESILISSDVSVSTSMEIIDRLKEEVKDDKLKDQDLVKQKLRDILKDILDEAEKIDFVYPAVIMVVGVNGVGKTTSIGKLANAFVKQNKSVAIAAADTFRAAASDQLTVWAERSNVRIIKQNEGSDPSSVVYDAVSSAKARKTDVLIIDTAGRLHNKVNLMEELKKMVRIGTREFEEANFYKLIVLDATTGQNALSQVSYFDEAVGIDGIILTKMDGTAKGGFVLSVCYDLEVPICFVGVGEGIDDIRKFDSVDFVNDII